MMANKLKCLKFFISLLFVIIFAFESFGAADVINKTERSILHVTETQHELTKQLESVNAGNHIQFGHYEQNNNLFDGPEKIDWIVLGKDDFNKKATLISLYVLDCIRFDGFSQYATWDISSLRNHLNNDMIYRMFTEEEMHCIVPSDIVTNSNKFYGSYSGLPTRDFLYIPSIEDIYEYFSIKTLPEYERWAELLKNNRLRVAYATDYAVSRGVRPEDDTNMMHKCNYFLRTTGLQGHRIWYGDTYADYFQSYITENGQLRPDGTGINSNDDGIRIMMQVYY